MSASDRRISPVYQLWGFPSQSNIKINTFIELFNHFSHQTIFSITEYYTRLTQLMNCSNRSHQRTLDRVLSEHTHDLSWVSSQRNARNVRNVTQWRHYGIGQSQPPATTPYAGGTLPSCGRHAPYNMKLLKLNLIYIRNCLTSKKPTKIWTTDSF